MSCSTSATMKSASLVASTLAIRVAGIAPVQTPSAGLPAASSATTLFCGSSAALAALTTGSMIVTVAKASRAIVMTTRDFIDPPGQLEIEVLIPFARPVGAVAQYVFRNLLKRNEIAGR